MSTKVPGSWGTEHHRFLGKHHWFPVPGGLSTTGSRYLGTILSGSSRAGTIYPGY